MSGSFTYIDGLIDIRFVCIKKIWVYLNAISYLPMCDQSVRKGPVVIINVSVPEHRALNN